ncbi:MAG: hypothetical protein GTO02_15140 [Candidatus Dadabacteria bacterium]|nr:hypothetical protein [Candidatus Dadabacteria bacterium]
MAYVFEEFIRNFYKLELESNYKVKRENIEWQLIPENEKAKNFLPKMETDISIESEKHKYIIDTKYYQSTLQKHTRYDAEKIHSNNLYQLFAYLKNVEDRSDLDRKCIGMLLYPTIDEDYSLDYRHNNQRVLIRTINLNEHWKNISLKLKSLVSI